MWPLHVGGKGISFKETRAPTLHLHSVETLNDGRSAVACIVNRAHDFDAVLLDICMVCVVDQCGASEIALLCSISASFGEGFAMVLAWHS